MLFRLARADIAFFLLIPLMILLFAGTVAQKYMGLYAAHKMFFASFIFWAGPVPLPGGYLLIGLLTLALLCKFILRSEWTMAKAGINLTHLGVLVLLAGGLLTALSARESFMIIAEGDQSPYVYDYIKRELVISSERRVYKIAFDDIKPGAALNLPFDLEVLDRCDNCAIEKREESDQDFGERPLHGMARFMALNPKRREKDPEADLSGLTFALSGLDDEEQNGIYIAVEGMPAPIEITRGGQGYALIFGKQQRTLPFSLKLNDFKKEPYPGTDKARAYSSDLEIIDGEVIWPVLIEMNVPLRYKGYTFYQSSFERTDEAELTILSVVENHGRLFPYIGTAIIAAGLLLHLFLITGRARST